MPTAEQKEGTSVSAHLIEFLKVSPTSFHAVVHHHRQMQCWNGVRLSFASPSARCLTSLHSCSKLFVGGLSYDTNETILKDVFGQHGEIVEVKVICDHVSGKSKGYGFVQFTTETAAIKALTEIDGQLVDGRNLRVHYAHKG